MTHTVARIRNGVLAYRDGKLDYSFPVGGSAWKHSLEQPDTTNFRFEHGAARFTARLELQRGHPYWYAYRRRGGRLRKAYLGRATDLTLDRLEEVGARLDEPVDGMVAAGSDGNANRMISAGNRHNLPSQVSSFLGRQAETAELRRVLASTRLLTLTGAGGMGKTRLALFMAAGLLKAAADAVWLVELAALTDPALVLQAVAQALGARQEPGRPLLATLASAVGVGRVVLVIDNCEHLVDACADLAASLLRDCPNLRILATSREPLGITGEVAWRVPSLGLPLADERSALEDLAQAEAVQLFVARAQAARPGFVLTEQNAIAVSEVCRRLDGIPLAIELAAAHVRVLAPDEVAARLEDRFRLFTGGNRTAPPRQQTLRAAVDWSYDLLTDAEQRLFECLSVFAGGFTLEAAEAVCPGRDGIEASRILDVLTRLVDRSLVLAEPKAGVETLRYRLLETLRVYGLERLAERGDALDRVRERHAAWIAEHTERAVRAFRGPQQRYWLLWAEQEHDNVRSALTWALEREEAELAARVAAGLSWSWVVHQRWSEGLDWVRRALTLSTSVQTRERGYLLNGAINLAVFQGDLTSNRPTGDPGVVGEWVRECLAIGQRLADDELVLAAHGWMGLLRDFGVEMDGLLDVSHEEMLAWTRRIGHSWGECRALEALARRALRAADLDTACARLDEAIQLSRAAGDTWSLAMALNALGDVERARRVPERAGVLYQESLALFAELGLGDQPSLAHNLGYVALAAGDSHQAAVRFASALVQFRRWGEQRSMAECLIGFGAVAAADGRPDDAARLFGAGEAALEKLGMQVWPSNRPDFERWQARARSSLNAAAYARASTRGRELGIEEAITWALEPGPAAASGQGCTNHRGSPGASSRSRNSPPRDSPTARSRKLW